jgi:hypothetical protein
LIVEILAIDVANKPRLSRTVSAKYKVVVTRVIVNTVVNNFHETAPLSHLILSGVGRRVFDLEAASSMATRYTIYF